MTERHIDMKRFTREELAQYDGRNGVSYVAYNGSVYDVSKSFIWKKGRHWARHQAGCDLTEALKDAPHGEQLLERVPLIGELVD